MEKKEISMEVRLLLAFLLMGAVIFVTPYFYKPGPTADKSAANKPGATTQEAKAPPTPPPTAPSPSPQVAPEAAPVPGKAQAGKAQAGQVQAGQVQADREETATIDTDLVQVTFSNKGGVVRSWILKHFKDHSGKPVDLFYEKAAGKVPPPFSIQFPNQAPQPDPNMALFRVEKPDDLTVIFDYSDGHLVVKKSFKFAPKSYLAAVSSQVTLDGTPQPHSLEWRGGFGDSTVVKPASNQHAVYYDVSNSKLNTKDAKDAKNGPVSIRGDYSFAGLNDSYFAGVFLTTNGRSQMELTTFSDTVPDEDGKDEQRVGAAVGGEGTNNFEFFAGPKDMDLLRTVNPKLEQLIEWGWFEVLAKPLFLVLNYTADKITHNWGWAIVLITIAINILLFPLKISGMKSSRKMQSIQPQLKALNEKYKNLKMNDPKKAEQNQEMMDLYKKNGINPVGGCLPMLLNLPFIYAFYKVLGVTIELRGASWLWVTDLSQPETLALRILPILLIVTQFLQQKLTPTPGMDPTQQKMMYIMPLFLGYVFYFYASGLVLYWLTSNVIQILQQVALNRVMPSPPPVAISSKTGPPKKK